MKKSFSLILLSVALTNNAMATQTNGSYLTETIQNGLSIINVAPNIEQQEPLKSVASLSFPQNIKNVGQALNFVLLRTGYSLTHKSNMSHQVRRLMSFKLPEMHRRFEQVTVEQMIRTLIGKGYIFKVDDLNREVIVDIETQK